MRTTQGQAAFGHNVQAILAYFSKILTRKSSGGHEAKKKIYNFLLKY
jgi:hypothetical protein